MDPRLRLAVQASRAWYDAVFALHDIPTACDELMWRALGDPPPYHSTAKTLQPAVPSAAVLERMRAVGSVADSFADLDLPGFAVLLEATWVHHAGGRASMPRGWSVITTPETLALWSRRHDYVGVLTSAVLDRRPFTVLGRFDGLELVGGAVLHDGSTAVGLSNAWAQEGVAPDPDELLDAARAVHPDRALVDYVTDDELDGRLRAGWQAVGPHRVWVPAVS